MGGSDQEVEVHGPVLALLEGTEAVEDQGLVGRLAGPSDLVEEEAVAAEALGEALEGAVGDAHLAGDLAQAGAGDQTQEEGAEEVAAAQPVGGGEGL